MLGYSLLGMVFETSGSFVDPSFEKDPELRVSGTVSATSVSFIDPGCEEGD